MAKFKVGDKICSYNTSNAKGIVTRVVHVGRRSATYADLWEGNKELDHWNHYVNVPIIVSHWKKDKTKEVFIPSIEVEL